MDRITVRLGGYQKPASIHNRAATRFGEILADRLGDRIAFELVGDVLALGHKSGDLPRMVDRGELSLCYMSTIRFTAAAPELKVFELPFVVRDRGRLFAALDGVLWDRFAERMHAASRFRLLGFWDNGFRHLTNKVRPIRAPADCRGIRVRTQMGALLGETFRALGFEPIAADIKEFVEQIEGDRFQAHDNALTNIYNFGVYRHHRYITLSGHLFGASLLVCNADHYASWPAPLRRAVDEAAREATLYQRQLAAAEDAQMLAKLKSCDVEIAELTDGEHAAFVAAVAPVLEKHGGEFDAELLRRIQQD